MARVFISFIEAVLEGGWEEISPSDLKGQLDSIANGRMFRAIGQAGSSELRIVEPEVVIRRFIFGALANVLVGNSVVSFDSSEIQDELTVDDKNRTSGGNRLRFD
jgi:hypothetical protein